MTADSETEPQSDYNNNNNQKTTGMHSKHKYRNTARLKTLLLKLSKYTIDLKFQKGSEMHTSDTLSRLHNLTITPNRKDIIP